MPSAIRVLTRFVDLDDVTPPTTDGQLLRWNAASGKAEGSLVKADASGNLTVPTLFKIYKSSAVLNTNSLGRLIFAGFDGIAEATGAYIEAVAQENWGAGAHGTVLSFYGVGIGRATPAEIYRWANSDHSFRDKDGIEIFKIAGTGILSVFENVFVPAGKVFGYSSISLNRYYDPYGGIIRVASDFQVQEATTPILTVKSGGIVGIGTPSPVLSGTGKLHMAADTVRLDTARTPATAGAAGNPGELCWDANSLYVCIATNTWRRIAHLTW